MASCWRGQWPLAATLLELSFFPFHFGILNVSLGATLFPSGFRILPLALTRWPLAFGGFPFRVVFFAFSLWH